MLPSIPLTVRLTPLIQIDPFLAIYLTISVWAQTDIVKYIAKKGSICINGVSLTVNGIDGSIFDVNIVPHTISSTTLGELTLNSYVNLEIDLIARYVERLYNENKK